MNSVFVYGTLRPGQRYHKLIEAYVKHSVSATLSGRLYHLPEGYPALVLASDQSHGKRNGPVRGELLYFSEIAQVLPILDELEDYYSPNDPRNLYERVNVSVVTVRGHSASCMVYLFTPDKLPELERRAVHIPNGDWVQWITANSRLIDP
ncbi:gamma-glutamylcyclotransferase family protein [Effusibacillus dendaii]|uniref:Gamma-glutamylcyclotransferase n=1 Tax=Effusibacillus dendaii TaxID=2743772 RepID=A0A7I8DD77_9BACL|nr:gamma-glutamylcyclotransferase family protein [Effusibacillus dendaii]BCJ86776.1 gamma-glutamylcyclotransferase [Effusibacillus dendaii]